MKIIGVISYNIYANFTNYGSALQSWALQQAINKVGVGRWKAILVDYCPEILKDKDPLNPIKNMWDADEESKKMCELSLPVIRENYKKFDSFYKNEFNRSSQKYTQENFDDILENEKIDGFVCGSDTIFCIDEFGFDDGYYANYKPMKEKYTISYAASFGDSHFTEESYKVLNERLKNFKALGLRENEMIPYIKSHTSIPVEKVIDPTLLLDVKDYDSILEPVTREQKYILLYARRYNKKMENFAEELAKKNNWKIIEISLRATNAAKHEMFYEAGVGEFLSLVKNAEFVITNSYHGMIFSMHYRKPFYVFSRELCNRKISELLEYLGLSNRLLVSGNEAEFETIDYNNVFEKVISVREKSLRFLETQLLGVK